MKKISYIELMEAIEEAIPQTTDFDYRNITAQDIWKRVTELLEKTGLSDKFTAREKHEFENEIKEQLSYMEFSYRDLKNNEYFDQNNDILKQGVITLRNIVRKKVTSKAGIKNTDFASTSEYEGTQKYGEAIGTDEEITKYTSQQSVSEYIRKLLTTTKAAYYDKFAIDPERIVQEIYKHFGFKQHYISEGGIDKLEGSISYLIDSALERSRGYLGRADYIHFDYSFETLIEPLVARITEVVCQYTQEALKQRQIVQAEEREAPTETPIEAEPTLTSEEPKITETKPVDYEEIITKYEKMKELIERNKALLAKIEELRAAVAENDAEIEKINSGARHGL